MLSSAVTGSGPSSNVRRADRPDPIPFVTAMGVLLIRELTRKGSYCPRSQSRGRAVRPTARRDVRATDEHDELVLEISGSLPYRAGAADPRGAHREASGEGCPRAALRSLCPWGRGAEGVSNPSSNR